MNRVGTGSGEITSRCVKPPSGIPDAGSQWGTAQDVVIRQEIAKRRTDVNVCRYLKNILQIELQDALATIATDSVKNQRTCLFSYFSRIGHYPSTRNNNKGQ